MLNTEINVVVDERGITPWFQCDDVSLSLCIGDIVSCSELVVESAPKKKPNLENADDETNENVLYRNCFVINIFELFDNYM